MSCSQFWAETNRWSGSSVEGERETWGERELDYKPKSRLGGITLGPKGFKVGWGTEEETEKSMPFQ